jgi:membrane-associated protease RseP (regulator of RpoE activity)
MKCFRHNRTCSLFVALITTAALVAAQPGRAQNPATPKDDKETLQRLETILVREGERVKAGDVLKEVLVGVQDPADEMLGATLKSVGDTLRAQLRIPAGQGLLVASLTADGACAQVGLKQNDILLSLAGQPLAAIDDLTKHLKAAGESAVPLKILRVGKPLTIQVRPIYRVTLGPATEHKAEYYLGVTIKVPNEAVRAQLGLPDGRGVEVNDVVSSSPAEKAGVKKHDILLELGGKLIDSPQTLTQQVQAVKDQPTPLTLLRGGTTVRLSITAAVRDVEIVPSQFKNVRVWFVDQADAAAKDPLAAWQAAQVHFAGLATETPKPEAEELRQRLNQVENELKALRAALEKLNQTIKDGQGAKKE